MRRSARGERSTMAGAAAGPPSLPSQARTRTGRTTPAWPAAQAIVSAALGVFVVLVAPVVPRVPVVPGVPVVPRVPVVPGTLAWRGSRPDTAVTPAPR